MQIQARKKFNPSKTLPMEEIPLRQLICHIDGGSARGTVWELVLSSGILRDR